MICLDYGLSFINTVGNGNAPRFWVESRCRIVDNTDGSFSDYYQCGSCKSERTFFLICQSDTIHRLGRSASLTLLSTHRTSLTSLSNDPLPSLKMESKLPKFTTIPKFGV